MLLLSLLFIAFAEDKETCCSIMILIKVANPGLLAQSGGTPSMSRIADKSLSILESLFAAISKFLLFRKSVNKLDYLNTNIFFVLINLPDVPSFH